jgi:AcrR family transcriptional regulator
MARPVNADADATRRRILGSAVRLFTARGEAASIRDIARSANVSLAMVHHYYGSKEALYTACVDEMYAELGGLRAELAKKLAGESDVTVLIERAVRTGFRFARRHQTAVRLLLRSVVTEGQLDPKRQREMQAPFLAEISGLLGHALGRSGPELRLPLQSVVALTARYAVSSERELAIVAGVEPGNGSEALANVEDHLVQTALALLANEGIRSCKQ